MKKQQCDECGKIRHLQPIGKTGDCLCGLCTLKHIEKIMSENIREALGMESATQKDLDRVMIEEVIELLKGEINAYQEKYNEDFRTGEKYSGT